MYGLYLHTDISVFFQLYTVASVTHFDKVRPAVIMCGSLTSGFSFFPIGAEGAATIHHCIHHPGLWLIYHIVLIVQYANFGFSVRGDGCESLPSQWSIQFSSSSWWFSSAVIILFLEATIWLSEQ